MDCPIESARGVKLPIRPVGIAFDLDGTLLDYDGRLSEAVAASVRLIARAGIKVFLVTGRLENSCEPYWRELRLDTPMATCNGAYVGFPGQEPFLHIRLSERVRDAILRIERENGLYVNYYIDNQVYALHDGPEREFYTRRYSPVELVAGAADIAARRPPSKCVCIVPESEQSRVTALFADALGDEVGITSSNNRFIELLPPDANKAVGLKALADWCGVPLEKMAAVGDGMNDLPMLQAASFSISFSSGNPRLAEHVDMLLPPLWEGGMDILARCILGLTDSGRFLTSRSRRFFKK